LPKRDLPPAAEPDAPEDVEAEEENGDEVGHEQHDSAVISKTPRGLNSGAEMSIRAPSAPAMQIEAPEDDVPPPPETTTPRRPSDSVAASRDLVVHVDNEDDDDDESEEDETSKQSRLAAARASMLSPRRQASILEIALEHEENQLPQPEMVTIPTDQLEQEKARVAELEEETAQYTQETDNLKNEILSMQMQLQQNASQIQNLKTEYERKDQEISDLQEKLRDMNKDSETGFNIPEDDCELFTFLFFFFNLLQFVVEQFFSFSNFAFFLSLICSTDTNYCVHAPCNDHGVKLPCLQAERHVGAQTLIFILGF
jgi:uncharacterized protein (UPF0335 family)